MTCSVLPLSYSQAKYVLPSLLLLLIVTSGLGLIGAVIAMVLLTLFVIVGYVYYSCCPSKSDDNNLLEKASTSERIDDYSDVEVNAQNNNSPVNKSISPRILYLDNLKTFLTMLVVVHHTATVFGGYPGSWYIQIGIYRNSYGVFVTWFCAQNQFYFMALFFFISAFFVPSSFDKKGATQFMKERFKRLGIPFIIMTMVGIPLLFIVTSIYIGNDIAYFPMAGPLWFCGWLLVFCCSYASMEGSIVILPFPRDFMSIVWIGLGLGFLNSLLMIGLQMGLAYMPITFGTLPFYVLFFCAGIRCRRSGWLKECSQLAEEAVVDQGGKTTTTATTTIEGGLLRFIDRHRTLLRFSTIALSIVLLILVVLMYSLNIKQPFYSQEDGDDDGEDDDDSDDNMATFSMGPLGRTIAFVIGVSTIAGVYCITISLCLIDFFRSNLNFRTEWSDWLGGTAYCVYIIHPWLVCPLSFAWIELIRAEGKNVYFVNDSYFSTTNVGNDSFLWLGFVVVGFLSVVLSWFFAGMIKPLPGFSNIL